MKKINLEISREILEAVRPWGRLYRLAVSRLFFWPKGQGGGYGKRNHKRQWQIKGKPENN